MKLSVGEAAKRLGVSIRTLRYYDEVGLEKPAYTSEAGYRYYDEHSLSRLTQALFYRELDMPIKEILNIMNRPDYDGARALQMHRELMLLKKKRIEEIIALIDETEGKPMKDKKPQVSQEEIENKKAEYAKEARERWGESEAYKQSQTRHGKYTKAQEEEIEREAEGIFDALAAAMPLGVESGEAQALIEKWRAHITRWHYDCSPEMLSCLGEMYVSDARFTENLDAHGTGLAVFMRDAIRAYCKAK